VALLTSGVSADYTGTSTSATVAVTAGAGNRKLIVGFAMEAAVDVTALTFNGQDLVALGLLVELTDISTDGVSRCLMFEQFDAGLPASGDTALSATFSAAATGGGRMFYWLVDGVRQDQIAEGASGQLANGGTSVATFQTDETFASGEDDRALCAVAYRNDAATSILLTTPSGASNIDAAGFTVAGGGRVNGSHKVGSMGTGTVQPQWTTQATAASRRTGAAVMLNPAASINTGSGASDLGGLEAAGSGTKTVTGSGASALGGLAASGSGGTALTSASGASALGGLAAAGAGTLTLSAAGAAPLGGLAASGAAGLILGASGAVALGGLAAAGSGSNLDEVEEPDITGSGASALGGLIAAGLGGKTSTASGGVGLGGLLAAGEANFFAIVRPGSSVAAHVAGAGVSADNALSSVSAAEAGAKVSVSRAI
jgi:hypothetical protein